MRIFVTGASGYIGSHLLPFILSDSAEIAILARPESNLQKIEHLRQQVHIISGDLFNPTSYQAALREFQPEQCIHLAWYTEPGKYLDASAQNLANLNGSLELLQFLLEIKCQHITMLGTCAEYDTDIGYLSETDRTKPDTIYAASKHALHTLAQQLAADADSAFAWIRVFYPYGGNENPRKLIPSLIQSLLEGQEFPATAGEQIRDYVHIEDVAPAVWFIAQSQLTGIFNVSSGEPVSIRKLMEYVGAELDQMHLIKFGARPYRNWEPMFICGNPAKLKQYGWQTRYTLNQGLRAAIDYWKNRGTASSD